MFWNIIWPSLKVMLVLVTILIVKKLITAL